jgi:hypothetical protein
MTFPGASTASSPREMPIHAVLYRGGASNRRKTMLDWLLGPKTETVSKADYDVLKADYDAQLVVLRNSFAEVEQLRLNLKGADATATRYRQMYTAAQAELVDLRAGRAKRIANLTAANERRKAEAQPALN